MELIAVNQGSAEWHELRRTHIGASMCPDIMGVGYNTPYKLWEQMVLGKEVTETEAMRRGSALEPMAREYIERAKNKSFRPCVGRSSRFPWQIASFDGLSDEYVLEIKCPGEKVFAQLRTGEVPEKYIWQIQHQLCVSDKSEAILLIFGLGAPIEISVHRDYKMISDLLDKEEVFYKNVIEKTPPELQKGDFKERVDIEWAMAANAFSQAKKERIKAEQIEEETRKNLIHLTDGENSTGEGVTVSKFYRKGNIEYSKIPELKPVNLDLYRKEGNSIWRVNG